LAACAKLEEYNPQETAYDAESSDWISVIAQINLESDIIVVQNGSSIQEAIDAAGPDASIYIEPGEYHESIRLSRSDIMLISAGLSKEEKVSIENPDQVSIMDLRNMPVKKAGYHFSAARNDLGGGVAHYTFDVQMGSGVMIGCAWN
jgi:pectin methylesterase-like acyl-CoA thioesterase